MRPWSAALALGLIACPQRAPQPGESALVAPVVGEETSATDPDAVIVLAAVQGKLVPLARTCAGLEGGEACDDDVPVGGTAAAPDGSTAVLGQPTKVVCAVDGQRATGFSVEGALLAPVYLWPATGSARWVGASAQPVDEALRGRALEGLNMDNFGVEFYAEQLEVAVVVQSLSADLDGDGAEDPVIRVFMASSDPDMPGTSVLYWGEDLHPVSNRALELSGRVDVIGALPTPHGTVLLVTDDWMGGSGVHALTVSEGELRLLGEWSCGT